MIAHSFQETVIETVSEKPEVDIQLHDLFPEIYQLPFVPHMQQPSGFENSMPEFQWRVVQNNKVDLVGPEYRVEDADQLEMFFRPLPLVQASRNEHGKAHIAQRR
jgi:hypothetical protein